MKTTSFFLILMSITAAARAQAPGGTWSGTLPDGSALSVTLKPAGAKLGGSIQRGGTTYQVDATLDGEDVIGVATSGSGSLYFEAHGENGGLRVIVATMNAQGQPDYQRAVEALLKSGGAPAASAAAPAASAGGNPLARASAAPDPFAGKFSGDGIVMSIAKEGDGYKGTLETQGTALPFTAQSGSRGLTGTFVAGGTTYMFEARLQGNVRALTSDGQTHSLQRQDSSNPLAAAPSQSPATAGQPVQTAQDQQLAQLLMSRRWCAFSFSSGGGSSGSSSTEKITFLQDGTVIQSTGGESYYSGSAGSVASDRSGGTRAKWKVEGGGLHVSADGIQWKRVNLKIEPNSNGYPILTADGREYSGCS